MKYEHYTKPPPPAANTITCLKQNSYPFAFTGAAGLNMVPSPPHKALPYNFILWLSLRLKQTGIFNISFAEGKRNDLSFGFQAASKPSLVLWYL